MLLRRSQATMVGDADHWHMHVDLPGTRREFRPLGEGRTGGLLLALSVLGLPAFIRPRFSRESGSV
jgi:hypothetical protein